jgi:CBS domain-containing protein
VVDARRHVVGTITGGDLLRRGDLDLRLSIQQELGAETLRDRLAALTKSRKSARDVMTHPVRTVEGDVDLATAVRLMAERRVKRLPVVDRRGQLVGIVSRADVLRAIAALPEAPEQAEDRALGRARTVGDAVIAEVPVVSPETLAEEVLVKLLESPLRRVVVVGAAGRVVGLIGDRDLLLRSHPAARPGLLQALTGRRGGSRPEEGGAALAGTPGRLTARELMAPSLITVQPDDSLVHAIRLMMQHQVKRLVVVDEAGRLRGLVDRREVLRALAAEPAS